VLARRNTLVPISILPAEVLMRIFHFVAFSEQPYMLGWVDVTHVCQRWRQIALDDSTLWTHFSTASSRNKEWVAERLSRARNAPLVIDLSGLMDKDASSLFLAHISHTRELYLRNLSLVHSEIVQAVNIQNAPALERLELSANTSPTDIKRLVGDSFFKGPLPKLRIFCVSQIVFPWSLVPRGRLTQLKVTLTREVPTVPSKDSQHDDLNQLIGLLVASPSLEVLTLHNCLPAMLSESSDGQTIPLPRLSQLCLRGSISWVTNLLKMLRFSASTTLRLNCASENTATHNDYHILPFLLAHFNDPTPVKFRSFKINLDDMDRMIVVVASTSLPISPIPYAHIIQQVDNDAELSLSSRVAELNNRLDILRRTCDGLPLSNLEFLSISFLSPNQFNWSEIFQHCIEVTTVQVYGRGTIGLLQALTPPKCANTTARGEERKRKRGDNGRGAQAQPENDDDNDRLAPVHVPIFPKLTSLLLEFLDFTDAVPGSGVLYDLVLSAVQRRKENTTPLTTLYIDRCVIREEQANALEKVVGDFRWDQDEGDRDNYHDYYDDEFGGWPSGNDDLSMRWGGLHADWEPEW